MLSGAADGLSSSNQQLQDQDEASSQNPGIVSTSSCCAFLFSLAGVSRGGTVEEVSNCHYQCLTFHSDGHQESTRIWCGETFPYSFSH